MQMDFRKPKGSKAQKLKTVIWHDRGAGKNVQVYLNRKNGVKAVPESFFRDMIFAKGRVPKTGTDTMDARASLGE